jgi:ADP-ribose pyrophosphatase YjhB (NUDIX family)
MDQRLTIPETRVTAKAAVVERDRMLLVEYRCPGDTGHFSLPGGRIRYGESTAQAVVRKVAEETCLDIVAHGVLIVVEYIPAEHEYRYGPLPRLQLVFRCAVAPGCDPAAARMPPDPEPGHASVSWIPITRLPDLTLRPDVAPALLRMLALDQGLASHVPLVSEMAR